MTNVEDNTLLKQWQDGSEIAFDVFYKKHLRLLLNIALKKTGDFELSREIVQDSFIVFYKKKNQIEDNPILYLQKILKYKILEYYKRIKNNKENSTDAIPHTLDNSLWEKILHNDTNTLILKAITSLPIQQRKIFLLSRVENMSNKEIATVLNISIKTVEASITRSLKSIRKFNFLMFIGSIVQFLPL